MKIATIGYGKMGERLKRWLAKGVTIGATIDLR